MPGLIWHGRSAETSRRSSRYSDASDGKGGACPVRHTGSWVHHCASIWRHMPYSVRMHRTTIVLPDDLDRRLSEAARRHRSSRTEILRQALASFLEGEARPRPRSIGLGRRPSPAVTSDNVKDVVRGEWRGDEPHG